MPTFYPEPTVGAVILNPENQVLLCRSHKWGNQYVIPGGHIELGESMQVALRREIKEETGLDVYDIHMLGIQESIYEPAFHEKKHFIFLDFICRTDSYEVQLNDEAESYVWASLDELDRYDLGGFVRQLLTELRKGEASNFKQSILFNFA